MKNFCAIALIAGLLVSSPALADEKSESAAVQLLDSMGMEKMLDRTLNVALEQQISQKPELGPFKNVMRSFFAKYMSYESLKPKLVAAYASEFTFEELTEAAAFYSTPTGKKFMEKMPLLYTKGAEIGQNAVSEHISELQQAIQEESKRLQALQQASSVR